MSVHALQPSEAEEDSEAEETRKLERQLLMEAKASALVQVRQLSSEHPQRVPAGKV